MNILKVALFNVLMLTALQVFAQAPPTLLCKGQPVPEGYVVSGESFSESCPSGAWLIKLKAKAPRSDFDQLGSNTGRNVSVIEPSESIAPGQCDSFQQTIKATYNFNPAGMNSAQVSAHSAKLDVFWNQVKQSRDTLVPCLRKALKDETSASFFNIDGSMLLVDLDPSPASKALQVRKFVKADLDGTDLEYWVKTMARRGVEGFDTSEAGAKWLSYPKATYRLSLHGGFPINSFLGALFIFGSMDEEFATPVLLRIANDTTHPHREDALALLMSQATPTSMRALKEINTTGMPAPVRQSIAELIERPKLLQPRAQPKLTREENLRAFQGIVDGDYSAFREMVRKAPDGEVDAVATLRPEDIGLLRRARRASISRANQHAVSDYASFTQILWALVWKPELVR